MGQPVACPRSEQAANTIERVDHPAQVDRFGFLHIDLNSFFASVEQQLHPEYRGKPVGVCGTMADTGALIAASYEAKALGIKTLTKVGEAKRICPDIILVNGNHAEYAEVLSHKISEVVESRAAPSPTTPSIDEMVCQLMGREREPPNAARRIAFASQAGHQGRGRRNSYAVRSAWLPIATSPRSPATCRSPTGSSAFYPRNCQEPSPTSNFATCPASARRPKSASTTKASPPWSSCSPSTAPACTSFGTPSGAIVSTTGSGALRRATTARPSPTTCKNRSATRTSWGPSFARTKALGLSRTSSYTRQPCASAWSTSTPARWPSPSSTRSPASRWAASKASSTPAASSTRLGAWKPASSSARTRSRCSTCCARPGLNARAVPSMNAPSSSASPCAS